MSFRIDHDYHIHSQLSACSSDPAQTPEALLQYASRNGLHTLVLTDHYWDKAVPGASDWYQPQDFDHISRSKPLPQSSDCRFLFGCETEMDRYGVIGIPEERYDDFDFIIIPTTHMHFEGFTIFKEEADTIEKRAQLYIRRFERFLNLNVPFHKVGIAHLTCPLILHANNGYINVLDKVPDTAFADLFAGCREKECGVEINVPLEQLINPELKESCMRPYRIAKEQGCRFYLGSDSHHPKDLTEADERFRLAVELLELTEDHQFILP